MKNFLELLKDILENGYRKINRTGTDTIAIVGRQLRFDLRKGFPLSTTRQIHIKSLIHELLFFIHGLHNNKHLVERGVKIWSKWALPGDVHEEYQLTVDERVEILADGRNITKADAYRMLPWSPVISDNDKHAKLDEMGVASRGVRLRAEEGELGPIYGVQWRKWKTSKGTFIDQLQWVIDQLRTNPYSRRLIVSAFNPEDMPDEGVSPQENAANGKQCLAACHTFFQLTVTPPQDLADGKGVLHLHLYQRSLDTPVGGPFNIASYSLLLAMIAQVTGFVAGEFIWTINDAHIYVDQIDLVKEELSRKPLPLPKLVLNPAIDRLEDFTFDDVQIIDYLYQTPQLKYPVAV